MHQRGRFWITFFRANGPRILVLLAFFLLLRAFVNSVINQNMSSSSLASPPSPSHLKGVRNSKSYPPHHPLSLQTSQCSLLDAVPRNPLRAVDNIFSESDVELVQVVQHTPFQEQGLGTPPGKLGAYCGILDSKIWEDCKPKEKRVDLCTSQSFIYKVKCGFINDNDVHQDVPGTVFDQQRFFKFQSYVRGVDANKPKVLHKHEKLAHILQAYSDRFGHFPHEVLPRLIWLLQAVPADAKLLYHHNDNVDRYLGLLEVAGLLDRQRLVRWEGPGHVYHAKEVYGVNEAPYCVTDNPHQGGTTTYFPREALLRVRDVLSPTLPDEQRNRIVVIRRDGGTRRLVNHDALLERLKQVFKAENIHVFTAAGPLSEHVDMFRRAALVIGPHGAGFANLVWCGSGTTIIELGYDSLEVMGLDDMYYKVSRALDLKYFLALSKGSYSGNIEADLDVVMPLITQGGERDGKHVPPSPLITRLLK
eukprot:GILI01030262.1.p1 GENE.GILI01030262.1~~GILI01030262.1.p1  ORF type:complete len:476 (+),score=109.42 GILI01030262.1:71-1498(+)